MVHFCCWTCTHGTCLMPDTCRQSVSPQPGRDPYATQICNSCCGGTGMQCIAIALPRPRLLTAVEESCLSPPFGWEPKSCKHRGSRCARLICTRCTRVAGCTQAPSWAKNISRGKWYTASRSRMTATMTTLDSAATANAWLVGSTTMHVLPRAMRFLECWSYLDKA